MCNDNDALLRRLIAGDPTVASDIRQATAAPAAAAPPRLLVAAALVSDDGEALLAQAAATSTTGRDRQLVAIAAAHQAGNHELVDVLVRDHLADHPDDVFAAWIASSPSGPIAAATREGDRS